MKSKKNKNIGKAIQTEIDEELIQGASYSSEITSSSFEGEFQSPEDPEKKVRKVKFVPVEKSTDYHPTLDLKESPNRKKKIIVLIIICVIVLCLAVGTFLIFCTDNPILWRIYGVSPSGVAGKGISYNFRPTHQ